MASSMKVYCQIVQNGLTAARQKNDAEIQRLLASGVDRSECIRRVLFPWKTPAQYQALQAEYDRAFSQRKVA